METIHKNQVELLIIYNWVNSNLPPLSWNLITAIFANDFSHENIDFTKKLYNQSISHNLVLKITKEIKNRYQIETLDFLN